MNINLTLFGQLISFVLFVWFTMKFVWPPIVKALEERKAKIADGLAAGERGQHEQQLAQQRAKEQLVEAKKKAAEIVVKAEKRAAEIVEEAKGDARVEGERLLKAAQVAELAIAGAEKILRKEINADAHRDIVDAVANQI